MAGNVSAGFVSHWILLQPCTVVLRSSHRSQAVLPHKNSTTVWGHLDWGVFGKKPYLLQRTQSWSWHSSTLSIIVVWMSRPHCCNVVWSLPGPGTDMPGSQNKFESETVAHLFAVDSRMNDEIYAMKSSTNNGKWKKICSLKGVRWDCALGQERTWSVQSQEVFKRSLSF